MNQPRFPSSLDDFPCAPSCCHKGSTSKGCSTREPMSSIPPGVCHQKIPLRNIIRSMDNDIYIYISWVFNGLRWLKGFKNGYFMGFFMGFFTGYRRWDTLWCHQTRQAGRSTAALDYWKIIRIYSNWLVVFRPTPLKNMKVNWEWRNSQ